MKANKKQLVSFLIFTIITYTSFSQTYTSWDDVETKRFGKESIFMSREDGKPLNGSYKISERSGAYADITFISGKINGVYTSYDFEGNKMSEATYESGKIEGKQVSYFQNGKVQEETFYKNGLKSGTWKTFNKKGEEIAVENYVNDKKDGKWIKKLKNPAENTLVTVTEFYKNGDATGHWEERLDDGKLRLEKEYSAPTDYIEKTYYPNGKISHEITVKDRQKNGKASYYTPEGLIQYKINYDNDNIVYREDYFENGVLQKKTSYKYGKINGLYERYNEDGVKIEEGHRKDTYKDGIWKIFEGKKGRLTSEINYTNNKPNGTAKFYDTKSKTVTQEGQYLNGKQHGQWKHYDASGELTKEVEYDKGREVSEKTYN